jgi:Histidine kinase-, DNA gyrase B-, and HSP90-like ATPase
MTTSELHVRSHVSRDLLQTAALFKNERQVAWEYVSNGLQYVDPGTSPFVRVRLNSKKRLITIEDNGRGMSLDDLSDSFFVMHGENTERRAGRPGRGRFGTGKSAAFGIGDTLRITTVKDGRRTQVELGRADLEGMDSGDPVPVKTLEREVKTPQPNGTLIEVEGVHLRSLDQQAVIHYIERHLARWPRDVTVLVNNHECEFTEPPVEKVETFHPSDDEREVMGDVELTIKVSKSPLDDDLRGVSIFSNGVWHETTLAGTDGKDMSEYLFGELDVPRLDEDASAPPPFDTSRSVKLNPENELVRAIYAFVGPKLEKLRKELVEAQREHRATEEAKRLRQEASKIEDIINKDFNGFRQRLQKVRAAAAGAGFDVGEDQHATGAGTADDFFYGGDEPAVTTADSGAPGKTESGETAPESDRPRRLNPIVEPADEGDSKGHGEAQQNGTQRPRGGFSLEFQELGVESPRATYQSEKRTIIINKEHPQIAAARQGRGVEDPVFLRLAYEVAFSEYAVALAQELDNRGEYMDTSDPIVAIWETLNRVAREAAGLYAT